MEYLSEIGFRVFDCPKCGIYFAIPADFEKRRRRDKESFYCPRGHSQFFPGKTDEQKQLERRERELRAERERAHQLEREQARTRRAYSKMRQRVVNGVCPCCNRQFQNVLQHMRTKHPEVSASTTLRSVRDMLGMTQADVGREAGVSPSYVSMYERDRDELPDGAREKLRVWVDSAMGVAES